MSEGGQSHYSLGCPFFKRDPARYRASRSCNGGFSSLPRVTEHLKNVHPPKCCKCGFSFENNPAKEHVDFDQNCTFGRDRDDNFEYMTSAQLTAVTKVPRKKSGASPDERWNSIYKELFPNDVPTTPYVFSVQELRQVLVSPPAELIDAAWEMLHQSPHPQIAAGEERAFARYMIEHLMTAMLDHVADRGLFPEAAGSFHAIGQPVTHGGTAYDYESNGNLVYTGELVSSSLNPWDDLIDYQNEGGVYSFFQPEESRD
ncbi:hypothetical protein GQ53DRAFT_49605 [Thozetella sp. PMI_491]|nr:hypothetical protein GQ53DRAFT_49605 [Thozetella sp. PMI_491]